MALVFHVSCDVGLKEAKSTMPQNPSVAPLTWDIVIWSFTDWQSLFYATAFHGALSSLSAYDPRGKRCW